MAKIILITGGTRSGKSSLALQIAEQQKPPHCFVATCRVTDPEMGERVSRHQRERDESIWTTVEEPLNLKNAISTDGSYSTHIVDCLTLWVSNIMERSAGSGESSDEDVISTALEQLFDHLEAIKTTVIFVTNEVGMGIVPENRLARKYRDLVGICNRIVALRADEVILVSCGLPLTLKTSQQGAP
ncbi:MAG: bifunctional adenosylcobinamide kinase/adenosylcobinamide-phosphate guanylyltransferase [Desulfocapsaceae bacterium]|jgi:adenosylcobinamide kinase/adenosylcobinamide-phosphate guanylyltransferase|nr:bifunctional adenosylcobinamide kinase/adenosylcobinamide-phosphate guanylyltransferase [Desulfocapsaceae bacterium]